MVVDTERMTRLGKIAAAVAKAGLSMQRQFEILATEGLTLDVINWKNRVSDPNLDTTERPADVQPSTEPQ